MGGMGAWAKARPKSRWADTGSCSPMPGIWAQLSRVVFPPILSACSTLGLSLGLCSTLCVHISMADSPQFGHLLHPRVFTVI